MIKNFYIIRHGETDFNKIGRVQGRLDIPLNDIGMDQASELRNKIKNINIDIIFSSDLKRAISTAKIINQVFNKEIILTSLLKEVDFGDAEGKDRYEVRNIYKDLLNQIDDDKNENRHDISIPNGETRRQVKQRIDKFLFESDFKEFKNILLSSHGALMNTLTLFYSDKEIKFKNCDCLRFKLDTKNKRLFDFELL
ncbi:MAG: putative phosphoserine phosphatase 2 [Alphaproteobacteria bacterium ADurb.Bin438]|nr:MAG: putative phosphoserine phosphatase 2 [Alphaproteobacteria bacterium ADurb.Bin438]